MANKTVKIGLSGASGAAQILHLPILTKMSNVEIVAICDRNRDRAQRIAERFYIRQVFSDFEEMIASADLDVIDVCSEVQYHLSEVSHALKAGKHVLVEKPFAQNAIEAEQMVNIAEQQQKQLMALMNLKFRSDAIALKSILNHNQIGKTFLMKAGWMRRNEKWQQKQMFLRNQQGVIMHLGLQVMDLGLWLLNNPRVKTVKAVSFNQIMKSWVEDTALIMLQMIDNTVFTIEVGWNMNYGKDSLYVELFGEKGAARLNPLSILTEQNKKLVNITPSQVIFRGDPYLKSYENEFSHFLFCLSNKLTLQSSGAEIIERFKIMDAIFQSIQTGCEVVLK
ncbi:MAG: Gfo/Idh/MocA family oxidoreductase [bacterium]|nr:Gfo/Idh/MocA family oxidoreductase [bacterium]